MKATTPSIQPARIEKARVALVLDAPFFGSLLMRLKMERNDSIPTFCTDGRRIQYNDAFCAGLTDAELRGVLIHEVCHCAQGHLWRMGARHPRKWNVACDFAVNQLLDDYAAEVKKTSRAVPWELPKGACLDPQFRGMASEEIYNKLPEVVTIQCKVAMAGAGKPSGGAGGAGDDQEGAASIGEFEQPKDEGNGNTPDELEKEWNVAVTMAATVEKMRGTLPGSIERMIGEVLAPKVPWREVLREFVRSHARDDYSFRRPNRRYLHTGVVLPGLFSERMGRIVIAVDTSGSIGEKELAEFQAEVQCALDECGPEVIDVIYCDAAVNGADEFQPGDTVALRPMGGGGTDFRPVFDLVEGTMPKDEARAAKVSHLAERDEPVCLIYLTDGWGEFPEAEPEYPVLWATTDSEKVPWGRIVAVK